MTKKITKLMLNGEEYEIREYQAGWQPGANTLAYYPLDTTNTVNDLSGNNKNLTNSNVTFGTYQGVDCGNFDGTSAYLSLGEKFTLGNTYTILAWYYHVSGNNGMVCTQGASSSLYAAFGMGYFLDGVTLTAHSGTGGDSTWVISDDSTNNGKWVLGGYTFNNGTVAIYENNVVTKTGSLSVPGTGGEDFYVGLWRAGYNYWNGGISKLIIEDKARTAQEISDYYNQTKSLYGIS